jgi:hypothetical protein
MNINMEEPSNDEISIILQYENINDILINDNFLYFIDKIFNNIHNNEYILENNINNNSIHYHIFFEINEDVDIEETDYFKCCKEINNILGKSEKIKENDILIKNKEYCNICFEEYSIKTYKRVLPDCKHCFHKKCIDKWLKSKSNCPICRTNLLKN